MNKLYAALVGTIVAGGAMAQSPMLATKKVSNMAVHPATPVHAQRGAAIWSDDFSDPSTWQMGGSGSNDWVIGQVAPNGDYPEPAILSSTASNGWAIYDSDLYCASSDDAWIQNVTPIDLTGYPVVQLVFEEEYRKYRDQTFVDVSNDGVNFTSFEVNSLVALNDNTTNPAEVIVPISGVAGGQSTVYIRFRFTSTLGCDYSWQVDDVSIEPVVGYNLKMVDAKTTAYDDFTTTTYDSLPYTIYPITEIRPLALNMRYTSLSASTENATATITTSDGYSATSTTSIAPSDTVQYYPTPYTPPASAGVYNINYNVTGENPDNDTTDNSKSRSVEVSYGTFARDEGALAAYYRDSTDGSPYKIGNDFHTIAQEQLMSIDVAFYSNSAVGDGIELNAVLMDASVYPPVPLVESEYHTLVQSELSAAGEANFVSFPFSQPYPVLSAGTDYFVAVQHFGGADITVGASGDSPVGTSFLFSSTANQWFYVTSAPMVRMTLVSTIGITENDVRNGVGLGQNVPNPANNTSTVNYSLDNAAQVNMNLFDINGKLVRTLVNGNMAAGNHRVDINTADLQEGVYFYTLTTDKSIATKRMTVVH